MALTYNSPLIDNITGSPTLDSLKSGSDKINNALDQILNQALVKDDNLESVDNATTAFDNIKQSGTDSYSGVLQVSTEAAALAGTNENTAMPPDLVHAAFNQYGLGDAPSETVDLNDIQTTGFIYAAGDSPNRPPTASSSSVYVLTIANKNNSGYIAQFVIGSSSVTGVVSQREKVNGTWNDWRDLYHTENVEATAQNLLENGSYGLGIEITQTGESVLPGGNLDSDDNRSGFYQYLSSHTGAPDSDNGTVEIYKGATGTKSVWMEKAHTRGGELLFRERTSELNPPSAWRKVFNTHNILGPVSQSGGVPTGAIIERGSNANGEYVKFADGTMIQTVTFTLTEVSTDRMQFAWTYPVSFISTPEYSNFHVATEGAAWTNSSNRNEPYNIGVTGDAANDVTFRIWFANTVLSSGDTITGNKGIAIGRWY